MKYVTPALALSFLLVAMPAMAKETPAAQLDPMCWKPDGQHVRKSILGILGANENEWACDISLSTVPVGCYAITPGLLVQFPCDPADPGKIDLPDGCYVITSGHALACEERK